MTTAEPNQPPGFFSRIRARYRPESAGTTVERDLDLRPAPLDKPETSEGRWWVRKPSSSRTTVIKVWDLIYGLQAQEAAIGSSPTEVEVEVMVMQFQQTAHRLESMGEAEKSQDVLQVLLPAFLQRPDIVAVMSSPNSPGALMPGAQPDPLPDADTAGAVVMGGDEPAGDEPAGGADAEPAAVDPQPAANEPPDDGGGTATDDPAGVGIAAPDDEPAPKSAAPAPSETLKAQDAPPAPTKSLARHGSAHWDEPMLSGATKERAGRRRSSTNSAAIAQAAEQAAAQSEASAPSASAPAADAAA